MSLDDIFRSFFGFSTRDKRPDPFLGSPNDREEEDPLIYPPDQDGRNQFFSGGFKPFFEFTPKHDIQDEEPRHNMNPDENKEFFSFHFSEPNADMFRHFDEMFRSFDEVFRSMGMAEYSDRAVPGIEAPPSPGERRSLRDHMLKQPDSHLGDRDHSVDPLPAPEPPSRISPDPSQPSLDPDRHSLFGRLWPFRPWSGAPKQVPQDEKQDKAIDEDVKLDDIAEIFKPQQSPVQSMQPGARMSPHPDVFKRVQMHTFRSADGKVEERRTVEEGDGSRTTTITRRMGDQTHALTFKEDGQGGEQKINNFRNMDETKLADFERRWAEPSENWQEDTNRIVEHKDGQTQSIMRNLFGFNFPGFPKP